MKHLTCEGVWGTDLIEPIIRLVLPALVALGVKLNGVIGVVGFIFVALDTPRRSR
jgi:hypothetical protein